MMNKPILLCLLTLCSLFAGCSTSSGTPGTARMPWEIKTYSQVANELQDVDRRIADKREDLANADSDEERKQLGQELWRLQQQRRALQQQWLVPPTAW
jgi:hypothetical protein